MTQAGWPATAETIDDPADERVREYTGLTDVKLRSVREPAEGLFMAESVKVIERAADAGYPIRSILTEAKWLPQLQPLLADRPGTVVYVGTADVIGATTGFRMHRGPMAAMQRLALPAPLDILRGAGWAVVLDGLVDHTNVGAAFRSAAAFGVDAVLVTPTCADPLYRRSVRVSMGTVFQVPWTRLADPGDLTGLTTVALTPDAEAPRLSDVLRELDSPPALVVGTEGPGLDGAVLARADRLARIEMAPGVDSLNVAAAVAVACYAVRESGILSR